MKIWSKRYRRLGRTRTPGAMPAGCTRWGELITARCPHGDTTARDARILRAIEAGRGGGGGGPLRDGGGLT